MTLISTFIASGKHIRDTQSSSFRVSHIAGNIIRPNNHHIPIKISHFLSTHVRTNPVVQNGPALFCGRWGFQEQYSPPGSEPTNIKEHSMISSIVLPLPGLDIEEMLLSPFYVSIGGTVLTAPQKIGSTSAFSSFQVTAFEYMGKTRTDITVTCLYETNAKQFKAKIPHIQVGYPIVVWGNLRDGREECFDMALTELHIWSTAKLRHALSKPTKVTDISETTNSIFDDIFTRIEHEKTNKLPPTANDSSELSIPTEIPEITHHDEVLKDTRKTKRRRSSPFPTTTVKSNPSVNHDMSESKEDLREAVKLSLTKELSSQESTYDCLRLGDLRDICRDWSLNVNGSKSVIISRLVNHAIEIEERHVEDGVSESSADE